MPREVEITAETTDELLADFGFADFDPAPAAAVGNGSNRNTGAPFDVRAKLTAWGLRVKSESPYEGGTKFVLEECPNDPSHRAPDSAAFLRADGKPGFKCLHLSCAGIGWTQIRERFEPGYRDRPHHEASRAAGTAQADNKRAEVTYQSLTLADLRNAPEPDYIFPGVLEMSQPGVIGGQYKSLKTTMAVELIYCASTGEDFLGQFTPRRLIRAGMFSGEAGPTQLRKIIERVARFHDNADPWAHEGLFFSCEKMPRLGSLEYMDALARWIDQHKLELLVIDPAYAAMAAIGDSAGNYYKVAELLFQVTDLQRKTGCIILLCPHMTKAPKYDPPMLSDIQWSGFGEWSGQWILMGKRREWDDQTGRHWLWMVAGGRSGHASTWGLDVREGRQDDIGGKVFEPMLVDKAAAFTTATDAQQEHKNRQATQEQKKAEEAIRDAFRSLGDGCHVKTHVLDRTGTSGRGKAIQAAWANMLRRGEMKCEPGACKGGNNVPCDGFRLHRKD